MFGWGKKTVQDEILLFVLQDSRMYARVHGADYMIVPSYKQAITNSATVIMLIQQIIFHPEYCISVNVDEPQYHITADLARVGDFSYMTEMLQKAVELREVHTVSVTPTRCNALEDLVRNKANEMSLDVETAASFAPTSISVDLQLTEDWQKAAITLRSLGAISFNDAELIK